MATRFDKSKDFSAPAPKPRGPDYSLEPVPLPDVVESDSDTVWSLFESSLRGDDGTAPTSDDSTENDESVPGPVYDDTVPAALDAPELDSHKKP
jgi:hypothetical protein